MLASLLLFVLAAEPVPTAAADDPHAVTTKVLDNGFTVLLSENHERPEIFGAVVVRTGGKNDPADNTGMAHYLEHMLFKGTQELGTTDWKAEAPLQAELERLYEQLRTAKGVSIEMLIAEIGWQAHSVRGFLSAVVKKKLALNLMSEIGKDGVRRYRIVSDTKSA